ncbi:unnamed protein product [Prorocentrum cordatum]|uniref:Uncharacterized protein n=1 Tax=Prorocentrum cordatum TaxID=2364126 RepID=A0ABN9YG88_9DINO|nr:unnamed protein product [Polarella glacialis]
MCWGLARRKRESNTFCSKMATSMLSMSTALSHKAVCFDLTQIACAFAILNFRSDPYMELVADKIGHLMQANRKTVEQLPDWGLCAVSWAFDQLYPAQSAESTFDGVWNKQGTIKGTRMIGDNCNKDGEGGPVYTLNYNGDVASLLANGIVYTGKLVGDGIRIEWSDGDIWDRIRPQPFADFQEKLASEISKESSPAECQRLRMGQNAGVPPARLHYELERFSSAVTLRSR